MSQQTVTINGIIYDTHTGLPLTERKAQTAPVSFTPHKAHNSQTIHRSTQKSQTLNRRIVKKAAPTAVAAHPVAKPAVAKSPAITKFAPHPADITRPKPRTMSDIAPISHPIAAKAHQRIQAATVAKQVVEQAPVAAPKPSHVIKQEAIAEALDKAPHAKAVKAKAPKQTKNHSRALSVMSASFALILLAGYFTYLNMPSLSVRVAAAQAGVNASYPGYHPDGYSINGPVAYSQGAVSMKFASNGGPQSFTVNQTKSSWDSSAVLENYVKQKAGNSYIQHNEQGLTVYVFGDNAAWVNGGILYTINGNAPLSSEQILHIATSM
jgi:hypothetical protein